MLHQAKWTNLLPRVCPIARTFYGTLNQPSNYQFQTLKLFAVVNLARGELLDSWAIVSVLAFSFV
jgi:hypothetical protein